MAEQNQLTVELLCLHHLVGEHADVLAGEVLDEANSVGWGLAFSKVLHTPRPWLESIAQFTREELARVESMFRRRHTGDHEAAVFRARLFLDEHQDVCREGFVRHMRGVLGGFVDVSQRDDWGPV